MNNAPVVFPFDFTRHIRVNICISRKIHFQQRIVLLFGAERLGEILRSPEPVILPLIDYNISFDVHVFILL